MTEQPILNYQPNEKPARKPKWVIAIVIIYLLLLGLLLLIPALIVNDTDSTDRLRMMGVVGGIVGVIVLSGLSLLLVPVKVQSRRPIRRGHIVWPMIGSGALLALLLFGGAIALIELTEFKGFSFVDSFTMAAITATIVWGIWSIVFIALVWSKDPNSFSDKLHRKILAGSVCELLVAVPSHVIVRQRNECCAGIYTGMGICIGVAVMLVSFGPSVLFLYWRRFEKIRNK